MKITLNSTPLLSTQQIGELASSLDILHQRTLTTIERLQKDIATRQQQIASRWKHATGLSAGEVAHFAKNETLATIREIKQNAKAELDKIIKDAGAPHAQLTGQRPFYDSPAKVLARAALGDPKRTEYLQQLQFAGPAELVHMAQVAVSTRNVALASAVLSLIDRLPSKDRPVGQAELANAMQLDDFIKVQEYIKLGDTRLQGILLAIRTWNSGQSNPVSTVHLALREQQINHELLEDKDE